MIRIFLPCNIFPYHMAQIPYHTLAESSSPLLAMGGAYSPQHHFSPCSWDFVFKTSLYCMTWRRAVLYVTSRLLLRDVTRKLPCFSTNYLAQNRNFHAVWSDQCVHIFRNLSTAPRARWRNDQTWVVSCLKREFLFIFGYMINRKRHSWPFCVQTSHSWSVGPPEGHAPLIEI